MEDSQWMVELDAIIRRALRARTSDPHLIEDITQETMERVAVARRQFEPGALRAYAVATARNGLVAHHRREGVAKRHAHRIVDYDTLVSAEEVTIGREEATALAEAMNALDDDDRRILVEHETDHVSVATLAAQAGTTPGAMAMRLARARALLRVEFLLVYRRVTLPTDQCRQVLVAISAGDQRRQTAVDAHHHMASCETCSELFEPLAERRRGAAAWWILPMPAWLRRMGSKFRHSQTAHVATGAAVLAGLFLGGYLLANADGPTQTREQSQQVDRAPASAVSAPITPTSAAAPGLPQPTATADQPIATTASSAGSSTAASTSTRALSPTVAAGSPSNPAPVSTTPPPDPGTPATPTTTPTPTTTAVAPAVPGCPPLDLSAPAADCSYEFSQLTVTEVPSDEGFWVMFIDNAPIWVQFDGTGESPQQIRPGQTIIMRASIRTVADDANTDVPPTQVDRVRLRGAYLSARYEDLIIDPS